MCKQRADNKQHTNDCASDGSVECEQPEGWMIRNATTQKLIRNAASECSGECECTQPLNGWMAQNLGVRDGSHQHVAHFGIFHRQRAAIGTTAQPDEHG